jgi:hypothetical protein
MVNQCIKGKTNKGKSGIAIEKLNFIQKQRQIINLN